MKAKKMAAFAMASVLALTAAVPAMAAEWTDTTWSATGTSSEDVEAYTVKDASTYNTDVNVTVNWSSTNGAYSVSGDTYTWVPGTGYTRVAGTAVTTKSEPTMKIELTNNSNVYENYTISYAAADGYSAIADNSTDSKTGTLVSYTEANAVIAGNTGTAAANGNMTGENTAEYTGAFTTTTSDLSLTGGATITAGTYTVTLSTSANSELVYTNAYGTALSATAMLSSGDAVQYVDPNTGKTNTAYNGYISATGGSNWYDAMAFVQMLNENKVAPSGKTYGTDGCWRLLNSQNDAETWIRTTNGTDSTEHDNFPGVGGTSIGAIWTGVEIGEDDAYGWSLDFDCWGQSSWYTAVVDGVTIHGTKSIGGPLGGYEAGFVVIWAPAA